jgi:hypothetical protein
LIVDVNTIGESTACRKGDTWFSFVLCGVSRGHILMHLSGYREKYGNPYYQEDLFLSAAPIHNVIPGTGVAYA